VRAVQRDGERTTVLRRTFDQQVLAPGDLIGFAVYPAR
jgi:hypothetical protein